MKAKPNAPIDELLPVNVMLAGRSYRIRIRPEDEASVRRSVKVADDKVKELRRHYAGKDDQDFLAMCLLMYAADGVTTTDIPVNETALEALIQKIDKALLKD